MTSDDPLCFIDLWIIEKFKILPTDKRFNSLETEQKIALFDNLNIFPKMEDIAKQLQINERIEKLKKQKAEESVGKGILKRMKEIFKKQGLTEKQVDKKLKDFCERKKQIDLKNLEKM